MNGKDAFELKTPWPDGTRVIFFSGEEWMARLSALVPPPRAHLVHLFGVLAPNAWLRRLVVPEPPEEGVDDPCGQSVAYSETRNGQTIRRRWEPSGQLILKVFAVNVMVCPKCDGRIQSIALAHCGVSILENPLPDPDSPEHPNRHPSRILHWPESHHTSGNPRHQVIGMGPLNSLYTAPGSWNHNQPLAI